MVEKRLVCGYVPLVCAFSPYPYLSLWRVLMSSGSNNKKMVVDSVASAG